MVDNIVASDRIVRSLRLKQNRIKSSKILLLIGLLPLHLHPLFWLMKNYEFYVKNDRKQKNINNQLQ